MQDTATAAPTKQEPDAQAATSAPAARGLVRVLVLGAQVWVLGCAWPLMDAGREPRALEYGLSLLCALALGAGAVGTLWGRAEPLRWVRAVCFLFAFPTLLAATCAARPEHWNELHYSTLGLCTLWLALCVYGASAAALCTEPASRLTGQLRSLDGAAPAAAQQFGAARQLWACMCGAAAIALTLVAPTLGGPDDLEHAFGDAAASGGVLTAVVGGALGVSTLAIFVGQGLRERRRPRPAPGREIWRRTLLFLALAALGASTYWVIGG
jgi:hypothetical protein